VNLREKKNTTTVPAIMISTEEAKQIITGNSSPLPPRTMALEKAAGLITAEDIFAPISIPAFTQSGMDGYALAVESLGKPISIVGEQAAGTNSQTKVEPGTAILIFTGAVVPDGADTVVVQEKATVINGLLAIEDPLLKKGANVRPVGSEMEKGALALPVGTRLSPAAIGFLAGMGIASVAVIPMPRVSIIVTGNELQTPGTPPEYGKVYESNSYALLAILKQWHITDVAVHHSVDDPNTLTQALNKAAAESDLILMTGGVSVGDYDFTVPVAEKCGIKKIFHKIKQKPGKPLFFGKRENLLFFGLPGNPASVLTCFYEYVLRALEVLTRQKLIPEARRAPLSVNYQKPVGITHYLKGNFDGEQVRLPTGQESYKLNSFALANCLVMIPEPVTHISAGELVEIHLLK
jgi:molybdopterin molybdotransferase